MMGWVGLGNNFRGRIGLGAKNWVRLGWVSKKVSHVQLMSVAMQQCAFIMIGFCLTGLISLCVDSFLCVYYFVYIACMCTV